MSKVTDPTTSEGLEKYVQTVFGLKSLPTESDMKILKEIGTRVGERSARLSAIALGGVLHNAGMYSAKKEKNNAKNFIVKIAKRVFTKGTILFS